MEDGNVTQDAQLLDIGVDSKPSGSDKGIRECEENKWKLRMI